MLKEENNDLRNRNNQLHETMKIKNKWFTGGREMYAIFEGKIKASISKEHNDHTYTSQSQRTDEQNKNDLTANHRLPGC